MEKGLNRLLCLLLSWDMSGSAGSDLRFAPDWPDFRFTGYELRSLASHVRKGRFQYPIYKSPPDLRKKRLFITPVTPSSRALKGRG